MSVGLLLVAHGSMGEELLRVAHSLLGGLPLASAAVSMPNDCDNGVAQREVDQRLDELDRGDGVLILTDLFGATPSNVCGRVGHGDHRVRRVSGLNLPMLLRVMNYAEQPLDDIARTAMDGGRNGIVLSETGPSPP